MSAQPRSDSEGPALTATTHPGLDPALVAELSRFAVAEHPVEAVAARAPFTGAELARLPQTRVEQVDGAFARARAAQQSWARTPLRLRARLLLRLHDHVLDHQSEVLDLIQLESGKARVHAFDEVVDVALVARHYARAGARMLRPRRRPGLYPLLTRVEEVRHPKGVVGIVSPWNYPLSLGVSDALPALLAGNAVVAKPDLQGTLTALWSARALAACGLPDGLFQVLVGDGGVLGPQVVARADHVAFTGSTRTGRQVAGQAAQRLVSTSLELGGKNSMIVLADADLDRAAEGAVRACFSSAGQLCVSAERLLVHTSVYDAFLQRFLRRTRAIRMGPSMDYSADMGSLVGPHQLAAVTRHVGDALDKGARLLTGGRARPDLGPYFYEPTVLTGVGEAMACHHEETFGPVVAVSAFDTEAEALSRANDTSYGLNASVWTRDFARGRGLAVRLHAGTVNINDGYAVAWGSVAAPMGGMKDSGLGRRHGAEGLLRFTEVQTVATARLLAASAPGGMGDAAWARTLTVGLRALRRSGLP